MDFNNGLYSYNGVPGLDASKGERIMKALKKLQRKIKHLEQARELEKPTTSKETQTVYEEDICMEDIKYMLLVLQLRYMRSHLRKNHNDLGSFSNADQNIAYECTAEEHAHADEGSSVQNECKETQTGHSLYEFNTETPSFEGRQPAKEKGTDTKSSTDTFQSTSVAKAEKSTTTHSKTNFFSDQLPVDNQCTSAASGDLHQQHYHLKFDDVPFILGASSSASHNVVANVQNIIAMMKSHNRALCGGPKSQPSPSCRTASSTAKSSSQDTNQMIKNLSQDLIELQQRQTKLFERFDIAQNGSHFVDSEVNISEINKRQKEKCSVNNSSENKSFKTKKEVNRTERHAVPANRLQSTMQASRQRLLRSIREFKTHLSEEDISWD